MEKRAKMASKLEEEFVQYANRTGGQIFSYHYPNDPDFEFLGYEQAFRFMIRQHEEHQKEIRRLKFAITFIFGVLSWVIIKF